MQITRQTEYAIRTLIELAKHPIGTVLQTKSISQNQGIPEVFLQKTIQLLGKAGFVKTVRGSKGGISLIISSNQITIARVFTAIEGNLAINPCLADKSYCYQTDSCAVHKILARAQQALVDELSKETIADIIACKD